jgi:hypothetical protein
MSSGEPLPDSIQEALVSVGSLAANGSFDETVARFARQKVFPKVKFVREGDFACKGEGSTLFKYIKEGLRVEKLSFKNWWQSGGWKKVRSQINKRRNTIQDGLKRRAIEGK